MLGHQPAQVEGQITTVVVRCHLYVYRWLAESVHGHVLFVLSPRCMLRALKRDDHHAGKHRIRSIMYLATKQVLCAELL